MAIKTIKRKFARFQQIVLIDIYTPGAFKPSARACLKDIGIGGAGFECAEKFENGQRLDLVIKLNEKEYVLESVVKRVARTTSVFSYGVEFLKKGFFWRLKMSRFIKKLARAQET